MDVSLSVPKRCAICCELFKEPKVLPCFHILCKQCILDLKVAAIAEIRCPVNRCGKTFKLENGDPDSLPDAYPVYFQRDLAQLKEKVEKNQADCAVCLRLRRDVHKAVSFCDKCDYLCKKCVKEHSRDRAGEYSDHDVMSFMELSQSPEHTKHYQVLRQTQNLKSFSEQGKCATHNEYNLERYCLECMALICDTCVREEHSNHHHLPLERAAERCRETINEKLPSARLLQKRMANAAADVTVARAGVEDQKIILSSSIDHAYERLIKTILQTKHDLHKTLDELADAKIRRLLSQQAILEGMVSEFQRLQNFTENTLETSTAPELLTNYKFLEERVQKFMKQGSQVETQPVELPNLALKNSVTPQIREICQKNLKIFTEQANPTTCTADGLGISKAEMQKIAHFTVNVVDRNNKLCSSSQDVSVNVKCLQNDYSSWGDVRDLGPGRFEVLYKPEFHGEHNVYVYVNGKAIAGSPFTIMVQKPPLQLGKSLGMIPDLSGPRGVAITEGDDLLVCEWNAGKIVKLDKLTRQIDTFGSDILSHPAGIALDNNENIYVVDVAGENSHLVKFSSSGVLLKSVGKTGLSFGEFQNPRGVRINSLNELVYVCDRDNQRIQVFDTELDYVRTIKLEKLDETFKHPCKPNDIEFNTDGKIYITDYSNHCILVLDSAENYLTNFSAKEQGGLGGPECLAIDVNGYLYVTESSTHRVTVFKTNGEFVVRFGKVGRNEGDLKFPMGIVVNENGSIYVCELLNNRIQVF